MAQPLAIVNELNNPGEEEVIRICVLGASGVGKSSLCNFLSNKDTFKISDGLDSCTQQSQSELFSYEINNKDIKFEITDTPGWFDADNDRLPSINTMLMKINECIQISETGITAFIIVIPWERISIDTEQSIYFMRDCFDSTQLKHVWMIFTKCHKTRNIGEILQLLLEQKNKGRNASGLIYNYSQQINEQCFATDTQNNDEKENIQIRENILSQIHSIYGLYGIIPDGVFQHQRKIYYNEISKLSKKHYDNLNITHRKYRKMLTLGTVIGVGFVAAGIKGYVRYQSLMNQHNMLKGQTVELKNKTEVLAQQTMELENANNELQNVNRQKAIFAGVTEVAAGALWFAIEPVSGCVAIYDGMMRLWGNQ
eukprot:330128_1